MEILLLVAAVVVLVGGLAVVLVNRRDRGAPGIEPDAHPHERERVSGRGFEGTPVLDTTSGEVRDVGTSDILPPEGRTHETATGPGGTDPLEAQGLGTPPAPEPAVRPTFRDRLTKARSTFSSYLGSVLSRSDITEETWDELEEALIRADVGVALTTQLLDELRATVKERGITDPQALVDALKAELTAKLEQGDRSLHFEPGSPNVWLFVGVNGVGKTTSIGKVGKQQVAEGRSVIMAAGDTFRAAAAEQLHTWSERAGADFHRGAEGGDPSSVIFDAIQKAGARGYDLVLADTAGRLHTKSNLMEELAKVRRVADRDPGNVTEVLLVLDATTGQNGLQQARQFTEATQCTGVVLTKLDGSAKGGIALAIALDLGLPIKLVGLGESADDLIPFAPADFVDALLTP
ncbi:MAG TPA: signal recognition particle-docking protein FtsY [Acidimicrobiales bacterium]|nr:signal recognition particle-docking protein FtsY [Acidimicrobiales bacterium]